ncbi:hypothetical protein BH10BAC3_BH10BAC3_12570 [soil metagenome]
MKSILFSSFCFCTVVAMAQVGIGTNSVNTKALLELKSSNRALLLPRMTTEIKTTYTTGLNASHKGMMLYDSTNKRAEFWNGTAWKNYVYTGKTPITVNTATNQIALNPGTAAGDLMSWDGNNWVNITGGTYVKPTASNMQPSLVLNYCIALEGVFPARNGYDAYIGEITLYGFNFAPRGWATCDGQLLPINQNQALFALLGTTYGGNGQTNFALPDLRGRAALHQGAGPGLTNRTIGEQTGTETVPPF